MLSVLSYYPKMSATMFAIALPLAMGLVYLDIENERKGRVDLPGKTQARAIEYAATEKANGKCID